MATLKNFRSAVGPALLAVIGVAVAQTPPAPPAHSSSPTSGVKVSPLAQMQNGRQASGNNRILTTGIRGLPMPSNHALIITVSGYAKSPLPGVALDRALALNLAQRFGVPQQNTSSLPRNR